MKEVHGSGENSHPEAIKRFRKEIEESGVTLIEPIKEELAYMPSPTPGKPGMLVISKGASHSAWCHEMQHMRDDRKRGWAGMRIRKNQEDTYEMEKKAYNIEIKLAEKAGRSDIVERLKANLEIERRRIYYED